MTFGEILYRLRKEKDLKQEEIAMKIGVKKNTVSNYENDISKPHYEQLVKLCNLFHVSPNHLMEEDLDIDNENELPPDVQQLKDKYDKLTDHDKSIVDYILKMEEESIEPVHIYCFPVFYQSAAAGVGRLSETEEYQMEEFELKSVIPKAVFGMYIKGHSMEPNILENDVVLIDPSAKVLSELQDEVVIALFGEELVCKRLSINNDDQTYDFVSDNTKDKDKGRFHQKQGDFKLVGKVVHVIHAQTIGNGIINYISS